MPVQNAPLHKPHVGVIGLGVMGENLALNIEDHGYGVALWNGTEAEVARLIQRAGAARRMHGTSPPYRPTRTTSTAWVRAPARRADAGQDAPGPGVGGGYNVIAFPFAAGVFDPLIIRLEVVAIAMSGSSLLVAANALLLKRATIRGLK